MPTDNRETLCFLHGWGFDQRIWTNFVRGLLPEWKVKILTLPGYDGVAPDARDMEEIARTLLDQTPVNATLIGWSLGGMVGIKIASMKPGRKLILLASTPCFIKKIDWPCGIDVKFVERMLMNIHNNPDATLQEFALLSSKGDSSPRTTYRKLSLLLKDHKAHPGALLDGLGMLMKVDLRNEFSGLKCEVGVIMSANDQLVCETAGAAMQALRPGIKIDVIEGAGHTPFISRPAQTRKSLLAMLQSGIAR